jgi:hypothetical protein
VAAAEALSDRYCIHNANKTTTANKYIQLSAMDLTSCDFEGENMGCLGGVPLPAWQYAAKKGIVTAACLPYLKKDGGAIDTCTPEPNCTLDKHDSTPYCAQSCTQPGVDYQQDKRRLSRAYAVEGGVAAIQTELLAGPVEAPPPRTPGRGDAGLS